MHFLIAFYFLGSDWTVFRLFNSIYLCHIWG